MCKKFRHGYFWYIGNLHGSELNLKHNTFEYEFKTVIIKTYTYDSEIKLIFKVIL